MSAAAANPGGADGLLLHALQQHAAHAGIHRDDDWLGLLDPAARDAARAAWQAARDSGSALRHRTLLADSDAANAPGSGAGSGSGSGSDATPWATLRGWPLATADQAWLLVIEREPSAVSEDLASFVRHLPFPTTVRSDDDTIQVVSDAGRRYYQRAPGELDGQRAREIRRGEFEQAVSQRHLTLMAQVTSTGAAVDQEYELPHPDGPRRVRLVLFPLDPPGTPGARIGSQLIDLTAVHAQRVELEREQARGQELDALLQAFILDSPALMTLKDIRGRYIGVSHAVCRQFNRAPSDYIGRTDHEVILDPVVGAQRHQKDLQILADGQVRVQEETFPLVPGLTLLTTSFPLQSPDGTPLGIGAIGMDVSELKRTQALVEEQSRQIEEFTYAAAHDLKEPLRTVTAYLSLVLEDFADDDASNPVRYLRAALGSAERMGSLISGLLQLASINRLEDPDGTLLLADLVRDTVADLASSLLEHGAEVHITGAMPRVSGNRVQLGQVLANLVNNGVKFRHPQRAPRIHIHGQLAKGRLQVSVTDNGIGIPEEHRERVFKVFERLHPRSRYDGQGIGLAVCRAIIARHGGQISAAPNPDGPGTRVHFDLPVPVD